MGSHNHKDSGAPSQQNSRAAGDYGQSNSYKHSDYEASRSKVYGSGYKKERIPYASQASSYPEYYRRSSERYGVMDWDQDSFYEPSSDYLRRRRLESERYADSSAQRIAHSWIQRGEHSGKGPKGYKRSDERIREDVCECLWQSGDIDASNIDVVTSEGEVTLKGTVRTRREKRLAEDLTESVIGVIDVHNQLRTDSRNWQGADAGRDLPENDINSQSTPWGNDEGRPGVQL